MNQKIWKTKIALHLFSVLMIFGFCANAQNVHYVLKPGFQYDRINSYSEQIAKVQIAVDSTGFIDRSGKLVFKINYSYSHTGSFHNGLASVSKRVDGRQKYGYINKKGQVVIPLKFTEAKDFSNNRAIVYGDYWQVINRKGKTVLDNSLLMTEVHNDQGGYDVVPASFHNGLMLTRRNGKFGYADTLGRIVIPCQYDLALDFSDGAALVADEIPYQRASENSVVDSIYNSLHDGPLQKQWMIIDTKGNVVYKFKDDSRPDWQENFSDGMVGFYHERKKGFVNTEGEVVIAAQNGNNPYPFPYSNGVSLIQVRGEKRDNSDGYFILKDTTGKTISRVPFQTEKGLMYDSNLKYHEGLLAVKLDRKEKGTAWGYIDKQGDVIIDPQFRAALDFHDGRAVVVTQEGKVGIIKNPLKENE